MKTWMEVSVRESPVSMVTEDDSCIEVANVPPELALQKLRSVMTWPLVPAQELHSGWLEAVTDPAPGEFQVTDSLVVTEAMFEVPEAPGLPVWSWTKVDAAVRAFSIVVTMVVEKLSATGYLFGVRENAVAGPAAGGAAELRVAGVGNGVLSWRQQRQRGAAAGTGGLAHRSGPGHGGSDVHQLFPGSQ